MGIMMPETCWSNGLIINHKFCLDCTVGPVPILLYIPHLDGNILVLHPLPAKIIEWWGSFLILWNIFVNISPSSPNLLIGRYVKTVHILRVSRTCSFSLYSTVRPIFCSCLHRQWLKWKLQPVITESGKTLFIALTTAASKSSFIIFGDQKEHQFFGRVNKKWFAVSFLFAKSAKRTFYAVCCRDVRINYTTKRTATGSF